MTRLGWGLWLALAVCNVYVIVKLAQPEIQAASDRICVPLYQSGMECCK